jgi:hypothetical protein
MNQRLIYWPMLAAGDFDLMRPGSTCIADARSSKKLARKRTSTTAARTSPRRSCSGAPEVSGTTAGSRSKSAPAQKPNAPTSGITGAGDRAHADPAEFYRYTGDEQFASEVLIPIADAVTEFFDLHYPRDANGKIRFEPAQALENLARRDHPAAGDCRVEVHACKTRQRHIASCGGKSLERWTRMLQELPDIRSARKTASESSSRRAVRQEEKHGKPRALQHLPVPHSRRRQADLQLARDTFAARLHQSHTCWSQDDIQMALLGLTDQAKQWIMQRASPESHSDSRFPAFWNAFKDWLPDIDHGGVTATGASVHADAVRREEDHVITRVAAGVGLDFKLHAPLKTIVEGRCAGGRSRSED